VLFLIVTGAVQINVEKMKVTLPVAHIIYGAAGTGTRKKYRKVATIN